MEYTPDLFLPEDIRTRVELVLRTEISAQQARILRYLLEHPGAYTHEIRSECAAGHATCRIQELNKGPLWDLGLTIQGEPAPSWYRNRFGGRSNEYNWRIIKIR